MDKWTSDSVLAGQVSNDENTYKDRLELQLQLILSAGEKNVSMGAVKNMADKKKLDMSKFAKQTNNITTLLFADASAGGLVATAKALREQIPMTQKVLSSTMQKQLRQVQSDATVMRKAIEVAQQEYKERMQALADTVASLIVQQDAQFARLTAQQARAMARASTSLQAGADRSMVDVKTAVNDAAKSQATATATASAGLRTTGAALGDVEDTLHEIPGEFKAAVADSTAGVTDTITAQVNKGEANLDKAADAATAATETEAMRVARLLARGMDQLDKQANKAIDGVVTGAEKNATLLQNAADKTAATSGKAIDRASLDASRKAAGIDGDSQTATSDAAKVAADMKQMIDKQGAVSSAAGSGFAADAAKLMALLTGKIGAITGDGKAVSQDVLGGTSDEAVRLSRALSYVMDRASAGAHTISGGAGAQLSASQRTQAELLAQRQGQVGAAGDSLSQAIASVGKDAARGAGGVTDRVTSLGSTFGGSIEELMAALGDTSGASQQALASLSDALGGKASSSLTGVMELLRGVNNNGADAEKEFLEAVVGPARDGAGKQFGSIDDLIRSLSLKMDAQSGNQTDAQKALKQFQEQYKGKLGSVGDALKGIAGLNLQIGSSVGAGGAKATAEARAKMMEALLNEMAGSKNQSADSLNQIDKLLYALVGGGASDAVDKVGQTFALVGANLETSSRDFTAAERDQLKGLSGLSSMAASLLGQSGNQALRDKATTEASLGDAKANIIAKFKEIASNTTNTEIGKAMQDLAKAGNDTNIINFLLGDVQSAMKGIDADAVLARNANEQKRAEFTKYIAATEAELRQMQAEVAQELESSVHTVDSELRAKIELIGSSAGDMTQSLNEIKAKVEAAQQTLSNNLRLYQDKLDGVIGEIKSYMNLSADADDLAIRQDIARQLAQVNSTDVAVASAQAAVNERVAQQDKSRGKTGDKTYAIVDNVIAGAVDTEASVADAHVANTKALIGVAGNVDAAAVELEGAVLASRERMQDGIAESSTVASKAVLAAEGTQAKTIDQVAIKSGDVASKSRKEFIRNLERMGGVDDDTLRVSKQLQDLMTNADGTISDVSDAALAHMDLSVSTMTKLNSAEVRKVASVSDVMGAFSSVVLSFLNETRDTMETVMNQLNEVDAASKVKLKQIDVRSQDELHWIGSGLNSTRDSYKQIVDQEQIVQSGLKQQIQNDERVFMQSEASKDSEMSEIDDAIGGLKQQVSQNQSGMLAKVRDWINSRNPQIAKSLFDSNSASFLQSQSREAVIRDIRHRMDHVKQDLSALVEVHV